MIIFISLILSSFFYIFWIDSYILHNSGDGEIWHYDRIFRNRTKSLESFIPDEVRDFFPMDNPVWILPLLLIFFPIFGDYRFLIFVQMFSTGAFITTFYILSKHYFSRFKSFLMALIYATSPFTIYTLFLLGFKPVYIALPLIPILFYAYEKGEYRLFLVTSVTLALTKQFFMVILIFFGAYIALKSKGQEKKYFLPVILLGLITTSIYAYSLMNFPFIQTPIVNNYGRGPGFILGSPGFFLERISKNFPELMKIFSYTFFTALLSPETIFISLPKIMDSLLTTKLRALTDEALVLTPFLYIASLKGLKRLSSLIEKYFRKGIAEKVIAAVLILMIAFNIYILYSHEHRLRQNEGYPTLNCGCCDFDQISLEERHENVEKLIDEIPEGSKVVATSNIRLFVIENELEWVRLERRADYIIFDNCLENCPEEDVCISEYSIEPSKSDYEDREISEVGTFTLVKLN